MHRYYVIMLNHSPSRALGRQLPALQTKVCVWKDNGSWSGYRGSIVDAFREDALAEPHASSNWDVYVSGPPVAVEAITGVAKEVGVARERLHVERFA